MPNTPSSPACRDPAADRDKMNRWIAEIDRRIDEGFRPKPVWPLMIGALVTGATLVAAGTLFAKYCLT